MLPNQGTDFPIYRAFAGITNGRAVGPLTWMAGPFPQACEDLAWARQTAGPSARKKSQANGWEVGPKKEWTPVWFMAKRNIRRQFKRKSYGLEFC